MDASTHSLHVNHAAGTTAPAPAPSPVPTPTSPPLVHPYSNIHHRIRHQGHVPRTNHSPSIRQSWLFPAHRATPSTAQPETTSVMTLNRPHNHSRPHPPSQTTPSSTFTSSSPDPAIVSPATTSSPPPSALHQRERRNFSGSARSRLSKIDRLSRMMLNPNSSAPNLLGPVFPSPASPRRARLSLQSPTTLTESPFPHPPTVHATTDYPRHIVMSASAAHRDSASPDFSGGQAGDNLGEQLSSSLPSAIPLAPPQDPAHSADLSLSLTRPEKTARHASMPLPRPGWRLYDLPDVEEAEPKPRHEASEGSGTGLGSRLGSSVGGEERYSLQFTASNASSVTNLDAIASSHTRQDSTNTYFSKISSASHLDLSSISGSHPLHSQDAFDSNPSSSPSNHPHPHPYGMLHQSPSATSLPLAVPKATKNSKSPLALRRSSTTSATSPTSPSNTMPAKAGSLPKSSLSLNTLHSSKTLTLERQKIILEILRTERSYVDGLVILQTLYYEPLNAPYSTSSQPFGTTHSLTHQQGALGTLHSHGTLATFASGSGTIASSTSGHGALGTGYYATSTVGSNSTLSASAAPLLSKKSIAEIFSNFSEILQINTLLLTQLETRICGSTLSTGWESDESDTSEKERGREGENGEEMEEEHGSHRSTWPEQVLVTVGSQAGEVEQILVLDSDWCVGDIFIEIAPFLKMYSNYVKTYTSALTHINDCMNRNDRFTEFLKVTAKRPECRNLDFQSYLMLPVQRIPRYRMLLETLLKHTPEDHADHRKLQTAFESMEQTANFVNETIRQHEMFGQMIQLQSKITGYSEPLLVPGRVLLKQGKVWKVCRRNVQVRVLILFSDCLLWTSPSLNPLEDTLAFHRKVALEQCTVIGAEDPDPTKNAFQIMSSEKSSQVYVDSLREKETWMMAIRRATQDYLSAKRTLKISTTPMHSIGAFGADLLKREVALWFPGMDSRTPGLGGMCVDPELTSPVLGWGANQGFPSSPGSTPLSQQQPKSLQPFMVVDNYNAPVWVPDHSATRCMICKEEFGTLFRRKHHCRTCGKVVCHSCSSRTILLKGAHSEKVGRACDDCIETMFPEETHTPWSPTLAGVSADTSPVDSPPPPPLEPDRRVSHQSLDGVLVRPEDYTHESAAPGATGRVRGFVEAGLSRMKSRSNNEGSGDSLAKDPPRGSNRKVDPLSSTSLEQTTQVKACGLCKAEFSMFKWRNTCQQCRRIVCSDCLTKKQIDQLFLLGLEAEREAKARTKSLSTSSEIEGAAVDTSLASDPGSTPALSPTSTSNSADELLDPTKDLARPTLAQSMSDSLALPTFESTAPVAAQRSQSYQPEPTHGSGSNFGTGWRATKGNTDSGHGQAEKLCDPCYLGLSLDHVQVLESGGGWQYYQATLGKHQTLEVAAALAMSHLDLGHAQESLP